MADQLYFTFNALFQFRYRAPRTQNPHGGDNHLEAKNWENSVLFLISCFQYILVAAVFSIGPPYRKSMWTNGENLMEITILAISLVTS